MIDHIKETSKSTGNKFPGKLLKENDILEDAEIADDDVLIAELKNIYII